LRWWYPGKSEIVATEYDVVKHRQCQPHASVVAEQAIIPQDKKRETTSNNGLFLYSQIQESRVSVLEWSRKPKTKSLKFGVIPCIIYS